jgi:hypothetical protein
MRLYRIREEHEEWLANKPETSMGLHVLAGERYDSYDWIIILGGQVAIFARELLPRHGKFEPIDYLEEPWLRQDSRGLETDRSHLFEEWFRTLRMLDHSLENDRIISSMEFKLFPIGPFPNPPQPGQWTYGHLPFIGLTGTSDVYYRWEPWPSSKRINQATGMVAPGTFTAPLSEIPFMPTGFSAVARLALPGLLPACFRWELKPPPNTSTRCGASVPLYGQSGGGVEVAFQGGFHNVGPIANPVILPVL